MSTPVGNLGPLVANAPHLKCVELPGSRYTNVAALAALKELEEVDLSGAKEPVDISFATQLPKLRSLDLCDVTVVNGAVTNSLPSTVRVRTDKKTKGL